MTPGARVAAAIEVLDALGTGAAAERTLTNWARAHRFAGAKDRAAIRDHVYDALRCRRSFAAHGGGDSGRALMIGAVRASGGDPDTVFTGAGHAPAPLDADERAAGRDPAPGAEALDCPDWLYPQFARSLGPACDPVLAALRQRAPVHLRVNLARAARADIAAALAARGIAARAHPLSPSALEVTDGARRLRGDPAYAVGLIEFQDAASQAVADAVPLEPGARFLDYCAGGGGKTLAVGARVPGARHFAHDANPRRMADLPARAARAGLAVSCLSPRDLGGAGRFETVLCDAPCSGSGSWRRDPEGKWRLTPAGLDDLARLQAQILDDAAALVAPGGRLVYATCSLFDTENDRQTAAFLARHPGWTCTAARHLTPLDNADGFHFAALTAQR